MGHSPCARGRRLKNSEFSSLLNWQMSSPALRGSMLHETEAWYVFPSNQKRAILFLKILHTNGEGSAWSALWSTYRSGNRKIISTTPCSSAYSSHDKRITP